MGACPSRSFRSATVGIFIYGLKNKYLFAYIYPGYFFYYCHPSLLIDVCFSLSDFVIIEFLNWEKKGKELITIPVTSASLAEILVSWLTAVSSSVSTLCSNSIVELFPPSSPFSSKIVTRKSRASVLSCKSARNLELLIQLHAFDQFCQDLNWRIITFDLSIYDI